MRSKRVTRFYCDHCSRGMFQRPAMERHELTCFRNPNRKCCACGFVCDPSKDPTEEMMSRGTIKDRVITLTSECPECLMSFVIRSNMEPENREDWTHYPIEDFKKDKMERNRERHLYLGTYE